MNYGLYMAASGVSANMARQNVVSNNLANVSTVGFKPDVFALRQRDPVRIEDNLPFARSDELLERLGGGVMPFATRINLSTAPHEKSDSALDVAISGDGFFTIRAKGGSTPQDGGTRLSRDGRFTLNSGGQLVTAAEGLAVLSSSGTPIELDPNIAQVTIQSDGAVFQNGAEVARLGFVQPTDPAVLIKAGGNLLTTPDGSMPATVPATGRLEQHAVEMSGVDAIKSMIDVSSASSGVSGALSLVSMFNEMMGRAITSLGRVS